MLGYRRRSRFLNHSRALFRINARRNNSLGLIKQTKSAGGGVRVFMIYQHWKSEGSQFITLSILRAAIVLVVLVLPQTAVHIQQLCFIVSYLHSLFPKEYLLSFF